MCGEDPAPEPDHPSELIHWHLWAVWLQLDGLGYVRFRLTTEEVELYLGDPYPGSESERVGALDAPAPLAALVGATITRVKLLYATLDSALRGGGGRRRATSRTATYSRRRRAPLPSPTRAMNTRSANGRTSGAGASWVSNSVVTSNRRLRKEPDFEGQAGRCAERLGRFPRPGPLRTYETSGRGGDAGTGGASPAAPCALAARARGQTASWAPRWRLFRREAGWCS